MNYLKFFQRLFYDVFIMKLKWKWGLIIFVAVIMVFSFFGGTKSISHCYNEPIDAVITWVNGSDPIFRHNLLRFEKELRDNYALKCPYKVCLPSHISAAKISKEIKLNNSLYSFANTNNNEWLTVPWESIARAKYVSDIFLGDHKIILSQAYWTTDNLAPNILIDNKTLYVETIGNYLLSKERIKKWFGNEILQIWLYNTMAIVQFLTKKETRRILQNHSWRIMKINQALKLNISKAHLMLELPTNLHPTDLSFSRFDDKEELRYCLRSIEKYAPWLRTIYIVTNGQIPYWLNLEYPKVKLITHSDIFDNKNDLPTFNSNAIEVHLHRIPEISTKFLYFNDDILLGKEIWPEDFETSIEGQKIYLSWPVPDCSPSCPWTWVNDGSCDSSCNTSQCSFDGFDCLDESDDHRYYYRDDHYVDYDFMEYPLEQPSVHERKMNVTLKKNETLSLKNKTNILSGLEDTKQYDTYAESLLYVNKLYNRHYSFKVRKVPSHMPHLIDKTIMEEIQIKFKEEYVKTSSHKFRSWDDMQMSFSYFYFLMSETLLESKSQLFDKFDIDGSETWSDREIRTIMAQLYNLPLTRESITYFEDILIKCALPKDWEKPQNPYERYSTDSKLPLITKELILRCDDVMKIIFDRFGMKSKFKFKILKPTEVQSATIFKMITSNISTVLNALDIVRGNQRKFICLNDNLDPERSVDNELIKDVLLDFYYSLFPNASKFELPSEFKNRFNYQHDLLKWQNHKAFLLNLVTAMLILLLIFITVTYLEVEVKESITKIRMLNRHIKLKS